MSKKVKIIIGANYGDEGKGLATDYFASKADGPVLNILYNGGPQRGHTVEHKNGLRHIFHHYGSGFFSGARTYFARSFLVDPIKFNVEHCDLLDKAKYFSDWTEEETRERLQCYIHPDCRVITPWDIMAGQIMQEIRGHHHSCGCGIWQTIQRYKEWADSTPWWLLATLHEDHLEWHLNDLRDWWFEKLERELFNIIGSKEYLNSWKELFFSDDLTQHFIKDIYSMYDRTFTRAMEQFGFPDYDELIFEAGQGLALNGKLDQTENIENTCCYNKTPSDTGSVPPIKLLIAKKIKCDGLVEIVYVTRSYFTRHGEGNFPTECKKERVCPDPYSDLTNQINAFQGDLRYGYFDWSEFRSRCINNTVNTRLELLKDRIPFDVSESSFVTWAGINPTVAKDKRFDKAFTTRYWSDTPYPDDVKVYEDALEGQ